jgi:hypothetical protein
VRTLPAILDDREAGADVRGCLIRSLFDHPTHRWIVPSGTLGTA